MALAAAAEAAGSDEEHDEDEEDVESPEAGNGDLPESEADGEDADPKDLEAMLASFDSDMEPPKQAHPAEKDSQALVLVEDSQIPETSCEAADKIGHNHSHDPPKSLGIFGPAPSSPRPSLESKSKDSCERPALPEPVPSLQHKPTLLDELDSPEVQVTSVKPPPERPGPPGRLTPFASLPAKTTVVLTDQTLSSKLSVEQKAMFLATCKQKMASLTATAKQGLGNL